MKSKSKLAVKSIQKIGTPVYLYDLSGFEERVNFFKKKMPSNGVAFFAMKANNHEKILKVIRHAGFGVDVVSLGELRRALSVGFKPRQIVFSGVGKTKEEIQSAIKLRINQINVESLPELERISEVAEKLKIKTRVALRVNPDIEVRTHRYIQTGFRENKFGLEFSSMPAVLAIIQKTRWLRLQGLTLHIGSQITEIEPFILSFRKTLKLYKDLKNKGHQLTTFDVGGGLGIDYTHGDLHADEKRIADYMKVVKKEISSSVKRIYFEPGRILVARFGALFTEVQYVKRTSHKNFLIVDTGMHQLLRPALYEAYHRIEPMVDFQPYSNLKTGRFDVVGPLCESSDILGLDRELPISLKAGDILKICDVGAYGAVMSNRYNLRPPVREVCAK